MATIIEYFFILFRFYYVEIKNHAIVAFSTFASVPRQHYNLVICFTEVEIGSMIVLTKRSNVRKRNTPIIRINNLVNFT